tara:strand:- start:35062 stop:36237 length:1176 start_codon:yes stop_codon:yes gene_type:complete
MDFNDPNSEAVVLVGGGFAGLNTAFALSRCQKPPKIILIEPRSRFIFFPLLFELLSGELMIWEVAPTYKSLIVNRGIALITDSVEHIDTDRKIVSTSSGLKVNFSQVVIATGTKSNNFLQTNISKNAYTFCNFSDVQLLRNLINELKFKNKTINTLVIVGAGPTGVELACKISDLLEKQIEIHLIEISGKILANSKAFNQSQAEIALQKRKIKIHLNTEILSMSSNNVLLKDIKNNRFSISHRGLIWTAGTRAFFPQITPQPLLIEGRLPIDYKLRVKELPNVFALGDVAIDKDSPSPATAQVAIQQAEIVASNVMALRTGNPLKAFQFKDFGEMLSLGIGQATITGRGITLSGSLAYQIRRLTYLTKMPTISLGISSTVAWLISKKQKFK